jgi:putative molybdopterin biosynthesis protein
MECVRRVQGLMVPAGNPRGIKGFRDLIGLDYVNRQKGSGTRVLCDYLSKQNGIDPSLINGYEREEFTQYGGGGGHRCRNGRCRLGILAAAKIYGLDFIPIAEEEYDLLIAGDAYETEAVNRLIIIIKSEEFAQRLQRLGGYTLKNPGSVKLWN